MSNPIGDFFATMQSPEALQDLEDSVFGVDLDVCEAQDIMSLTSNPMPSSGDVRSTRS